MYRNVENNDDPDDKNNNADYGDENIHDDEYRF